MGRRVVIVGIGGASCSGKTLLAKHIRQVIPNSTIVHQDDFVPPEEEVPYSKDHPDLQDWDEPSTCVDWERFRSALRYVRQHGRLPEGHSSHDHLNKQVEVEVEDSVKEKWMKEVEAAVRDEEAKGDEILWFLVDGFVLYYDSAIVDLLDIKVFLRVPHNILKERRDNRRVYVLQNGDVWTDPPDYFSKIVYPAYVTAHEHIFESGDIEHGAVKPGWLSEGKNLTVIPTLEGPAEMTKAFENSCAEIVKAIRGNQ